MFSQTQSTCQIESLESRLCLSSTVALSAHELHVAHLDHLQHEAVLAQAATTLSAHQRHLAHLRHLQVLAINTDLIAPVSTDINDNLIGTEQSLFNSSSPIGTFAPVGTTAFTTGSDATIGTLAPIGSTAFATDNPIGTDAPIGTIAPVGTSAFDNNLFASSTFDASLM